MIFSIRLLGTEVLSLLLGSDTEPRTQGVWIGGTGGSFELDTDELCVDYDEEENISPDDPVGFGFGGR